MVKFGQSGYTWVKVVAFVKKWLYLAKRFYSAKVVLFGQKWLYSDKVVVFGLKCLY